MFWISMQVYSCIYSELRLVWYLKETTCLHASYCNGRRLFHMALRFCIRIRHWISCAHYPYPAKFAGVNNCLSSRLLHPLTKAVKFRPEIYTTKAKLLQANVLTILTVKNKRCQIRSSHSFKYFIPSDLCSRVFPCSIRGLSTWDLWWKMWHWERLYSEYFGFPHSLSFHQRLVSYMREMNLKT